MKVALAISDDSSSPQFSGEDMLSGVGTVLGVPDSRLAKEI